MDAIILAGGLGTRLRAVVPDVPKPLAPVGGRPFLDRLLHQLQGFGSVEKVVLAIGYKAQSMEAHYRDVRDYRFEIAFSVESEPLGTGGAVLQALRETRSPQVLVLNGDSYVEFDLDALFATHIRCAASITMVVIEVEDRARYGTVVVDDSGCRIVGFLEKGQDPGRGLVNAGCYLLERTAFEHLPVEPSSLERDIIPHYLATACAHRGSGRFIDIGTPESYALAAEHFR